MKATTEKGCPQRGVLSPLLWSLVIDDLLRKFNERGFTTGGYADDLVFMVRDFNKYDQSWYARQGLGFNTSKTVLVPFS